MISGGLGAAVHDLARGEHKPKWGRGRKLTWVRVMTTMIQEFFLCRASVTAPVVCLIYCLRAESKLTKPHFIEYQGVNRLRDR